MSLPALSIRLKLPLLISALLLAVTGSFSLAAYGEARKAAVAAAGERLRTVTQQLAGLLTLSASRLRATAETTAVSSAVQAYLRSPTDRSAALALAALQTTRPQSRQVVEAALWNARGEKVLSTSSGRTGQAVMPIDAALLQAAIGPDTGVISPFRTVADSVQYAVVVSVTRGHQVLGYYSQVRQMTSTAREREQTNALIGVGAALLLGDTIGGVWTDLGRPVSHPPVHLRDAGGLLEYQQGATGPVFAAASGIAHTPWIVVVEFPRGVVLAPARRFLGYVALIAGVILVIGLASAWALSGTITVPLQRLTSAAEAVAVGDYSRPVRITRRDELGRVAEVFNSMAQRVHESQQRLEGQVHDRTAELEALQRAQVEQARAEDALRVTRSRLEQMVNASTAVIYAVQITGDTFTPVWRSENITRLTGYDLAETMRPGWWYSNLHPEDRERAMREVARLLAKGEFVAEYRLRNKDGTYRWILDEARLQRGASAQPAEAVGAWIDITDRKRLEMQLQQAQKMEAVGQLAGGIAHDFNNMLTAIAANAELVQDALPAGDALRDDVEEIKSATTRAAALTRQLLAFSRQQVLQPRVLELDSVVMGMDRMLRRIIGEDVDLVTVLPPGVGRVEVDPGQIEQIVLNLAVNARDAMPTGGKLTIETARVEFDEAYARSHAPVQPGSYVMLAVSDTGMGMTPEVKARVFEPFFTTKEPGKGTGLGLATVYGIVKQSGGFIWVYSEPGAGTAFKLYLPRVEEAAAPLAPRTVVEPQRGTETILLVEDEAPVRRVAREVLRRYGYKVLEARRGEEALAICQDHPGVIHLVVTDVVMPGMSGPELVQQLSVLRPGIKVLFASGYPGEAIAHHGILDQGVAFLQKPFSVAELASKVREVLEGEAVRGP
jgi:PAS domain S-box-containing protein